MQFFKINDTRLSEECRISWQGLSLETIDRVGPSKAALIKKSFLHLHWLVWCCSHHPEETKRYLSELKDPQGIASYGLLQVRYKLGDVLASNVIGRFGQTGAYGDGFKPPKQILEMIGVFSGETKEES